MIHVWPIRVYYEDTDLAGIVYYANYLRFIERARSEMVRAAGIDQTAMKVAGLVFAVRRVEADYLSPARYDDQIEVRTRLAALKGASFDMAQDVWRGETLLFRARVAIVVLSEQGRATRLPAELRARVASLAADMAP
ncbi:tol-pal system-associated acyl-CoA thioesterase [Roseicyclus mahoneyensis]|jgi:acyl-CoA thioester hydrolase|uniref:Acyl-CoA thioester hydrolase n=1 Tax=Roseicyclus mahoneyensis TaxID=164332 RepID=A0A316GWD1_9RHOB|nr:tol-pal system-associated acyl-CoA thioesterase [Roseicyclus mahoneyensis]PWK59387.1 acyl-CoA thioester hydrolase [Roseicyclus mahoneyensis]